MIHISSIRGKNFMEKIMANFPRKLHSEIVRPVKLKIFISVKISNHLIRLYFWWLGKKKLKPFNSSILGVEVFF